MEVLVIAWMQRRATIYQKKKENKNENIGKFVGAKGMHCFMAKQSMNETIYPENLGHFIAIFLYVNLFLISVSNKKNRIIWNILVMCFSNNTLAKLNNIFSKIDFFLVSIVCFLRKYVQNKNVWKTKSLLKRNCLLYTPTHSPARRK